ncbi:hypothetical protein ACJX0J_016768 [Zea mays]
MGADSYRLRSQGVFDRPEKLEEIAGKLQLANEEDARLSLQREGMDIDREAWLKEAEAAERAGHWSRAILQEAYIVGGRFEAIPFILQIVWIDEVIMIHIWLNRAVTLAPDVGDFWAFMEICVAAEPKHGEKWQAISKSKAVVTHSFYKMFGECVLYFTF